VILIHDIKSKYIAEDNSVVYSLFREKFGWSLEASMMHSNNFAESIGGVHSRLLLHREEKESS